jgi:hypothetical protein
VELIVVTFFRLEVFMPGFPFKLLINVLRMVVDLLEYLSSDDDDEKGKIEERHSA